MRALSLVVCRGTQTSKANYLSKLILKNNNAWKKDDKSLKQQDIYWDDHRVKRLVRLLLYFSTILPNKFLSAHRNDPVFEAILCQNDIKINDYKQYEHIFTQSFVDESEQHFDQVFDTILNEHFLDVAFGDASTFVKQEAFMKLFTANGNITLLKTKKSKKAKRLDWLFSPVRAYMLFKQVQKEKGIVETVTENTITDSDQKSSSGFPSIEQPDKQSTTDVTSKLGTASQTNTLMH